MRTAALLILLLAIQTTAHGEIACQAHNQCCNPNDFANKDNPAYVFTSPIKPTQRAPVGRPEVVGWEYRTRGQSFGSLSAWEFFKNGFHLGEDWNSSDGMDDGAPVFAIADGEVVAFSNLPGSATNPWGRWILIQHSPPSGFAFRSSDGEPILTAYSFYAHLSAISIEPPASCTDIPTIPADELSEGYKVRLGWKIGSVGDAEGQVAGAHLHFEIRTQALGLLPGAGYSCNLMERLSPIEFISNNRLTAQDYQVPRIWIHAFDSQNQMAPTASDGTSICRNSGQISGSGNTSGHFMLRGDWEIHGFDQDLKNDDDLGWSGHALFAPTAGQAPGATTAKWKAKINKAGRYRIETHIPYEYEGEGNSSRGTVVLEINHTNASLQTASFLSLPINQQNDATNLDTWESVFLPEDSAYYDSYWFEPGNLEITLDAADGTGDNVVADATRITFVSDRRRTETEGISPFADVPSLSMDDTDKSEAWFSDNVLTLEAEDKVEGYFIADGGSLQRLFAPTAFINRAEFIKLLIEITAIQPDISDGDDPWYRKYFTAANNLEVFGAPTTFAQFNGDDSITRRDAYFWLMNLMAAKNLECDSRDSESNESDSEGKEVPEGFPDVPPSDPAYRQISDAQRCGIADGFSNPREFRPENFMIRAEAAKLLVAAQKMNFDQVSSAQ